jgi:hypothetical protein
VCENGDVVVDGFLRRIAVPPLTHLQIFQRKRRPIQSQVSELGSLRTHYIVQAWSVMVAVLALALRYVRGHSQSGHWSCKCNFARILFGFGRRWRALTRASGAEKVLFKHLSTSIRDTKCTRPYEHTPPDGDRERALNASRHGTLRPVRCGRYERSPVPGRFDAP